MDESRSSVTCSRVVHNNNKTKKEIFYDKENTRDYTNVRIH